MNIIDVLRRAEEASAIAAAKVIEEAGVTLQDIDGEMQELDNRWCQLDALRQKLKAALAPRPASNGKPLPTPTASPARLPVPVSSPAALPVPGLVTPAPADPTPLPEKKANGYRSPHIKKPVPKDERRAALVKYILRNGPATYTELVKGCDVPEGSMRALLDHEWFERAMGKINVTNDARQAVEAGREG